MSNHGYITSKKTFKPAQVIKDLQEINQRRFKGLLTIEKSGSKGSWFVMYQGGEYPVGFHIWITSPKKLEHRHTSGWAFYLEVVFSEEMAAKYNGILSDEGISDKWKPDPAKYPSYESWVRLQFRGAIKRNPVMAEEFISMELKYAPKELRDC